MDKDRRRAVRIPAKLAMEIKLSGKDFTHAEAINVSANGIYFSSPVYIEILTKLQITLVLRPEESQGIPSQQVTCEGVVVRTQPEEPIEGHDRYEVACYFTSIDENGKEILESYILKQLAF